MPLQNLGLYKTFAPPHGENWKYKPLGPRMGGGDIFWNDLLTHKYPTLIPSQLLKHVTLHTLTKQSTHVVRIREKCDNTRTYELARPTLRSFQFSYIPRRYTKLLLSAYLLFADAII